jgi:Tetratricopeptide repeat
VGKRAGKLARSPDRSAVRDLTAQISALRQHFAGLAADAGDELAGPLLPLRFWALDRLNELGDSVSQAIAASGLLAAGFEEETGPGHPEVPGSPDNGAAARQAEGHAAERIALLEHTLATRERLLGSDHPDTLTTHNSLAAAYWDASRTAEAIRGFERTLAARELMLGADHPRTLNSRGNLAEAYRRAGAPPRRSRCSSGRWPGESGSWASIIPLLSPPAATSPRPTETAAGSPTRSPCSSRSWTHRSGSWVLTTPAPWPRGTASLWPARKRAEPPLRDSLRRSPRASPFSRAAPSRRP